MHDKLLWGAAWAFRATANKTYLEIANSEARWSVQYGQVALGKLQTR